MSVIDVHNANVFELDGMQIPHHCIW